MTIYIVRHGKAAAGVEDLDPGLDETGHAQARAAAAAFAGKAIGHLVVSPLRRTRETMDPIATILGGTPEVRDEVAEVFDPAMPAQERRAMIGPFMAGRWSDQSEVLRDWRQRTVDAVTGWAANTDGAGLLIVSHYIAIGVLIGEATGDDRVVPTPIANASITSFDFVDGRLRLLSAGATDHIPAELVGGATAALLGTDRRA